MSETPVKNALPITVHGSKKRSMYIDLITRLVREKPLATVGGIIFLIFLLLAIFANVIAPYSLDEIHLTDDLQGPSSKYLLGTDELGRDLLTRIIYGARISILVGIVGSVFATLASALIGIVSGYLGGKFDILVQRFIDAWMCFPGLLIALGLVSVIGPGLWQVIIVIGLLFSFGGSRIIRSAVIGIKENAYVQAAVSVGSPTPNILLQHILPNIMAPIIILLTSRMAAMILTEASLSFLGYGIPPPNPSWGGMLSGSGRVYMLRNPWMVLWPGLALSVIVYGINMLGDGVRDILDPRLRGGRIQYSRAKIKTSTERDVTS